MPWEFGFKGQRRGLSSWRRSKKRGNDEELDEDEKEEEEEDDNEDENILDAQPPQISIWASAILVSQLTIGGLERSREARNNQHASRVTHVADQSTNIIIVVDYRRSEFL